MATPFIPFDEIKRSITIEEVMTRLGLPFKKDGASYRCECPVHKGGKRSLVVTPDEKDDKGDAGVFFCFREKVGGDRVGLYAHAKGLKQYAAFKELQGTAPVTVPEEKQETVSEKEEGSSKERGFRELPYLEPTHPAVEAMGFSPDTAQALGIGYAPRGHHKQRIAVPLRLADGRLVGYISLGGDVLLPPKWHL